MLYWILALIAFIALAVWLYQNNQKQLQRPRERWERFSRSRGSDGKSARDKQRPDVEEPERHR